MSKSLKRVVRALVEAGVDTTPVEMPAETRTAAQAATAVGCDVDQIAKSIIFFGDVSGRCVLFITAGGRQVDATIATHLTQEPLVRADAARVRTNTGFAIGGVAPIGHLTPPRTYLDETLLQFPTIWAAAGTPRHLFEIAPVDLVRISDAEVAAFVAAQ